MCVHSRICLNQDGAAGRSLDRGRNEKCRWLKPELVAQIEFTEWTQGNHLRHSHFAGLRDDKDPRDVHREL